MNYIYSLLIVALFAFAVFYKSEILLFKKKDGLALYNEDYLGVKQGKSIRGIMAICIVLTHLSAHFSNPGFLIPFKYSGYLIVAVFFFFSGYGLTYSFYNKENYLKSFIPVRLSGLLIPFLIFIIPTQIIRGIINGSGFSIMSIFVSLYNMWFCLTILVAYVVFYISHIIRYKRKIYGDIVYSVLFLVAGFVIYHFTKDKARLLSLLAVPLGVFWYHLKDKLDEIIHKRWLLCTLITGVAFTALLVLKLLGDRKGLEALEISASLVSAPFFAVFVMLVLNKIKIGNRINMFLGKISYEIFLVHYTILMLIRDNTGLSKNMLLDFICVLAVTIAIAYIINLLSSFLIKLIRKKCGSK